MYRKSRKYGSSRDYGSGSKKAGRYDKNWD
jgi:hypothetical protein